MIIEETKNISNDCKMTLLAQPILQHLPPVKKILTHFETVHYRMGELIIAQGSLGDYYYVIQKGECVCTRKASKNAKEVVLSKLEAGTSFGEDALIIDIPRDLTITALTEVSLLRLSKPHFLTLIKDPALTFINYVEMQVAKSQGAVILDVRKPEEYDKQHIEGSINIPFFSLRMQMKKLNPKKFYMIVCNNGKTSEAAAFLLVRHKFEAVVLKNGADGIEI